MKKMLVFSMVVLFGLACNTLSYAADRELPWSLQRSSKIVGSNVHNPQGQSLGDIEDIVVDTETGRIGYAVISFGGFLGVGDKLFAVPMGALKRDPNKADTFVLNMDKERLKNAPGFDKDKWPRLDDRQWLTTVYTFYGQPFYWETSGAVLNATVADTKGTLKLKTADGRMTELVVPEAMMHGLQAGDRVEVIIREK